MQNSGISERPGQKNARASAAQLFVQASAAVAAIGFVLEGWPLAVVPVAGLVFAILGLRRARRKEAQTESANTVTNTNRRPLRRLRAAAISLVILHLLLGVAVVSAARAHLKGQLVTRDLQLVWRWLQLYHQDSNFYPETLADLVFDGGCTVWELESIFDPHVYWWTFPSTEPINVTYAWRPGGAEWRTDRELILVHDPAPYSRPRMRLVQVGGRFVLFADARVEFLSEEQFAAALRADAARRREIGWPVEFAAPPVRYMSKVIGTRPATQPQGPQGN